MIYDSTQTHFVCMAGTSKVWKVMLVLSRNGEMHTRTHSYAPIHTYTETVKNTHAHAPTLLNTPTVTLNPTQTNISVHISLDWQVQYSTDGSTFADVDGGASFTGSSDSLTINTNAFAAPVTAQVGACGRV